MDVQKLIDDVERLRALIKSWSAAGPAGALERDLVLEKLRGLYETILLSEPVPACGVSEPHAAVQGEASVPTAGRPGPDAPSESAQEKSSCDVGSAAAGEGHAEKEIPAATAGDVPEAVAISEAIKLAKKYSTEQSSRFIHGVLGAIVNAPEAAGSAADAGAGSAAQEQ